MAKSVILIGLVILVTFIQVTELRGIRGSWGRSYRRPRPRPTYERARENVLRPVPVDMSSLQKRYPPSRDYAFEMRLRELRGPLVRQFDTSYPSIATIISASRTNSTSVFINRTAHPGKCLQYIQDPPCRAAVKFWFYHPRLKRCTRGRCGSEGSLFSTKRECVKTCMPLHSDDRVSSTKKSSSVVPSTVTPLKKTTRRIDGTTKPPKQKAFDSRACVLPPDPGSCREKIPSWHYSSGIKDCEKFTYGGCGGNNNRFLSKRECKEKCYVDAVKPE